MSYEPTEMYAAYDENRVRARIAHQCAACEETITPGDFYFRVEIVFHGAAESLKRCARCQTLHLHLRDVDFDTWPDERLNCGEEYEEHWGKQPPEEIAALAFVTREEAQAALPSPWGNK